MMLDCTSIEEVRDCIDRIDDQIVRLIGERSQYVRLVMKFKKEASEANVPGRNEEIIERVRRLSVEYGLDPAITEGIYRTMIDRFVEFQKQELLKRTDQDGS